MNKLIALISLASAFIVANTPELNKSIYNCIKRSQNLSTALITHAELSMKNNPKTDLLKDEVFMEMFIRYQALKNACSQKMRAMAEINEIVETKLVS